MITLKPIIGQFPANQLKQVWTAMSLGTSCDHFHYGTSGMAVPFAWAPWRFRGTIEAGSLFRPGIRCASVSDAWTLFYGLSRIDLSDASGSLSGTPRWQATGVGAVTATRRVDPTTWMAWHHVDVDDGLGGVYQRFSEPPRAVSAKDEIKRWWDFLPERMEDHFMADSFSGGSYQDSRSYVRWWPWWYAEVQGGELTGAVYLVVESGFSGRYYRYSSSWYHIQCYLGCQRYYSDYATQPQTFQFNKRACGVDFTLYGCYFATKGGNLGLATPILTDPQKRFQGAWS